MIHNTADGIIDLFPENQGNTVFPFLTVDIISLIETCNRCQRSLGQAENHSNGILLRCFTQQISPLCSTHTAHITGAVQYGYDLLQIFVGNLLTSCNIF